MYDVRGRLTRRFPPGRFEAGANSVLWDGRDGNGRSVPAGVYFVRMSGGPLVGTKKVIHLGR